MKLSTIASPCAVTLVLMCVVHDLMAIEPIARRLPPMGMEIPSSLRDATLQRIAQLASELKESPDQTHAADVDVLLKATRLAVFQREIYRPGHIALLSETLDLAEDRLAGIRKDALDWQRQRLTVRGFYSHIDASPQPYGLVLPKELPSGKRLPLFVWLHGRGDKTTDIHFIKERLTKVGQIAPPQAIVLHPFGRQCIGFKSAGEVDVLEAIEHVCKNYPVDPHRVVLMGFSMGGAGAWHLGAHYSDRFIAVSPGAGFAETSRYQRYTAERIADTPSYEQQLWGVYDVPNYVRNLFNLPVVCYSGENDKQIQAARVMEEAFAAHGKKLDHVIGPGMGHKYHPDALAEIMAKMDLAVKQHSDTTAKRVHLQTRTLRYASMHWVHIEELAEHWQDSRVDAELKNGTVEVATRNVVKLKIAPIPPGAGRIVVDGTDFDVRGAEELLISRRYQSGGAGASESVWKRESVLPGSNSPLTKRPGLQGPIDDAFLDRFLVVTPTRRAQNERVDEWTRFELQHLRERWSSLFRATLPEKTANEVTAQDIRDCHLVLFGGSAVLDRVFAALPGQFKEEAQRRMATFGGPTCVPLMIYPNPLNPSKYVVLNSGPTFRAAHDRTNSLQNPKLPDWAIIDVSEPPNAESPGKVVKAGFFDENWQFKPTHPSATE